MILKVRALWETQDLKRIPSSPVPISRDNANVRWTSLKIKDHIESFLGHFKSFNFIDCHFQDVIWVKHLDQWCDSYSEAWIFKSFCIYRVSWSFNKSACPNLYCKLQRFDEWYSTFDLFHGNLFNGESSILEESISSIHNTQVYDANHNDCHWQGFDSHCDVDQWRIRLR